MGGGVDDDSFDARETVDARLDHVAKRHPRRAEESLDEVDALDAVASERDERDIRRFGSRHARQSSSSTTTSLSRAASTGELCGWLAPGVSRNARRDATRTKGKTRRATGRVICIRTALRHRLQTPRRDSALTGLTQPQRRRRRPGATSVWDG